MCWEIHQNNAFSACARWLKHQLKKQIQKIISKRVNISPKRIKKNCGAGAVQHQHRNLLVRSQARECVTQPKNSEVRNGRVAYMASNKRQKTNELPLWKMDLAPRFASRIDMKYRQSCFSQLNLEGVDVYFRNPLYAGAFLRHSLI